MSKEKQVPAIRFKGYEDEWKIKKNKDICLISTGKSNTQDRVQNGCYPFYVRSPIIERSNKYLFNEEAVLTVGDGVGTGKVFHYVNEKYDLHQRVYRMYSFNYGLSGKYFYYYFSNNFIKRVIAMTAKTSVDSVRYDMISEMDIVFPSQKEQIKITEFLSSLDRLITKHQQKHDKLTTLKKAMLEKMFPQNGTLIPEIRFKGFTEEWEEKKLGKIAKITTGNSNREDSCLNGKYTFFDRSIDIRSSKTFLFDCEAIIVAGEGSDFKPKYFIGKFDLHQRTYAIMNFNNSNGEFLYFYIFLFREYFYNQAVGSTVKSLRLPMFQEMPVKIPSLEEQQKIGQYFSNLDNLISLEQKQIDTLKNIKKACLEKMFV